MLKRVLESFQLFCFRFSQFFCQLFLYIALGFMKLGIIKVAIARDHPNTKYLNNTDKHEAIDLASASIDFSDFDTDKDKNLSD